MSDSLPLPTRLWFAFVCFFRILLDGRAARRFFLVRDAPTLPEARKSQPPSPVTSEPTTALQLLSLLQREGRLMDFIEQDITSFADAEVGQAARVIHEGCRRALHAHGDFSPVRQEPEGQPLTVEAGYDPSAIKLTGNVQGQAPFKGTLRHRGWRVNRLELPTVVSDHDLKILAPAEVEL